VSGVSRDAEEVKKLLDTNRKQVLADIARWLDQHARVSLNTNTKA
jgi:hypothetical protein